MVKVAVLIIGNIDQTAIWNQTVVPSIEILLLNQTIEFECAWQKTILEI